jgi:hypothetical protein
MRAGSEPTRPIDEPSDASPSTSTGSLGGGGLEIVSTCVLATIVYGILHDQVTARIAVEHFTVFHPRVIDSVDPTALALVFGVLATWWVGVFGGLLLAAAARLGSRRKRPAASLRRPLVIALASRARRRQSRDCSAARSPSPGACSSSNLSRRGFRGSVT